LGKKFNQETKMPSYFDVLKRYGRMKGSAMAMEGQQYLGRGKRYGRRLILNFVILLVILGVIVGAFILFIPENFQSVFYANWLWIMGIGLIAALLFYLPKEGKLPKAVVAGLIVVALMFSFFYFSPDISYAYDFSKEKVEDLGGKAKIPGLADITDPDFLIKRAGLDTGKAEGPEFATQSISDRTLSLASKQVLSTDPPRVDFTVRVKSPEKTSLIGKCLMDGKDENVGIDESFFEIDKGEDSFTATCFASEKGKEMVLILEGQFISESSFEVRVGELEEGESRKKGILNKKIEGPYPIVISTALDRIMPLDDLQPYRLYVTLTKTEKNAKMKNLDLLEVKGGATTYDVFCEEPLDSLKAENLGSIGDKTSYVCEIDVDDVPDFPSRSWIVANAKYTIEKEFKTQLS